MAILAKWYINSLIDKRMAQKQTVQPHQNNVKIILVKKASDYNVVKQLSKASMEQAIVIVEPGHKKGVAVEEGKKFITLPTGQDLALKALSSSGPQGKRVGDVLKTMKVVSKLKDERNEY